MRKNIFLSLVFLTILLISCDQSSTLSPVEDSFANTAEIDLREVEVTIGISADPYRNTESRKRDGKNCGCSQCFGICNIEFDVEFGFVIAPGPTGGETRAYLIEQLPNIEEEFGIDGDMELPQEYLVNTGITQYILKSGVYSFNEVQGQIQHNNQTYQTYGFVDIDHFIQ